MPSLKKFKGDIFNFTRGTLWTLAWRRGTVMADGRQSPDDEHEDETVRYAPTSAGPDADCFATLYALSWPAHGTRHA